MNKICVDILELVNNYVDKHKVYKLSYREKWVRDELSNKYKVESINYQINNLIKSNYLISKVSLDCYDLVTSTEAGKEYVANYYRFQTLNFTQKISEIIKNNLNPIISLFSFIVSLGSLTVAIISLLKSSNIH